MLLYAIRPICLVRIKMLQSSRIGHFTANTELYLCERDFGINCPKQRHVDLFYNSNDVCNKQLTEMWKREIKILPAWILSPIFNVNCFLGKFIPNCYLHEIGDNKNGDRDILNLWEKSKPHLKFTLEEEAQGEECFKKFKIPTDAKFVCLCVRDSAYLNNYQFQNYDYHSFRDGNIDNYVLAAEELARRGYFVFRMGTKVLKPIKSSNPRIIDYANSKMRSDFFDIFLAAKCSFCICGNSGLEGIFRIFRKPIVSIMAPIGLFATYSEKFLLLSRHHLLTSEKRKLKLKEIVSSELAISNKTKDFESKGVNIVENSSEEIRDIVIEMADRLEGKWKSDEGDEKLQNKFWEIFRSSEYIKSSNGKPLHGELKARFGTQFLKENPEWIS